MNFIFPFIFSLDHILSTRETQGHLEVGGRCSDLDPGVIYVLAARTPVGNCSREISLLLASEGVPEEGGRQADDMWFVLMVGGVAFVAVMVCLLVAVM